MGAPFTGGGANIDVALGAAYVFTRGESGGVWTCAPLTQAASAVTPGFWGLIAAVSGDGTMIFISGAWNSNTGTVSTFVRAAGKWVAGTIAPTVVTPPPAYAGFGISLASNFNGQSLVVGALDYVPTGAAYHFEASRPGAALVQTAFLVPEADPEALPGYGYGFVAGMSKVGDRVIVGGLDMNRVSIFTATK